MEDQVHRLAVGGPRPDHAGRRQCAPALRGRRLPAGLRRSSPAWRRQRHDQLQRGDLIVFIENVHENRSTGGVIDMTMIPTLVPPLPTKNRWHRSLAPADALSWLAKGWQDLAIQPMTSLSYGLLIFLTSVVIVGGLFRL